MSDKGLPNPPPNPPTGVQAASQDVQHDDCNNLTNKRKQPKGSNPPERAQKRVRELTEKHDADGLTTEVSKQDRIGNSRARLRDQAERQSALFFVELTPRSSQMGATCQFLDCSDKIQEGDYRIAVHPGMNNWYGNAGEDGVDNEA
ncbi:hypothetical protein RRF57_009880 [Xylaria bambusicola]|uniref:Uncharacterized protein n=1 Tax=Xylaria bambusicola TaxID=326684 RepID=A0AAN7UXH1_9PEZI